MPAKKRAPEPSAAPAPRTNPSLDRPEEVYVKASEVFRVLSAPMRLKIINYLCDGEQNVGYLLSRIDATQPNMSQHLNHLYKAGILARRREGPQMYYRIANDQVVNLCKTVCMQVAD